MFLRPIPRHFQQCQGPVFCWPSRVEGGPLFQTAASPWIQLPPKWTTCTGWKHGRAGSNNETSSWCRVSPIFLSSLLSHFPFLFLWPLTNLVLWPPPGDIKEDILKCNSAELSFALARFIQEARRPNGEAYSPDSIFYLCLGIQQVPTLELPTKSSSTFLNSHPTLRDFLWTVPVYARPNREHLHRPSLQPVHCWDHRDAATLEAEIITQWYESYRNSLFLLKAWVISPWRCCIHAFSAEMGPKCNTTLACAAQHQVFASSLHIFLPAQCLSLFISHIQTKGEAESWKWAELLSLEAEH